MHQDCLKCVEPKSLYDTIRQMFYNEFTGTADIKNSSMKGYTIFLYDIENKEINTAAYISPPRQPSPCLSHQFFVRRRRLSATRVWLAIALLTLMWAASSSEATPICPRAQPRPARRHHRRSCHPPPPRLLSPLASLAIRSCGARMGTRHISGESTAAVTTSSPRGT